MNEIIPGLFIGDGMEACNDILTKDMIRICVSEKLPSIPWAHHIAFMVPNEEGELRADIEKLNTIAMLIGTALCAGRKAMVFCGAGMERSPLAVTWYLYQYRRITLDKAWQTVKEKRTCAIDRRDWLPGSVTAGVEGK